MGAVALSAAPAVLARPSTSTLERVVNVTLSVQGQGTIVAGATGQSCTGRCVLAHASGTVLEVTAVPGTGSTFSSWSGACVGTAPTCAVAATGAATVQATFISTSTLSMTVAGAGTVSSSPAGISCGDSLADCTATYDSSQLVTLTPTPAGGATFDGWGGPCAQYGTEPCRLDVAESTGVTASFRRATPATGPQTLSVTHGIAAVLSAPDVLTSCAESDPCTAAVPSGTSVTLDAGGTFVSTGGALPSVTWTGDCIGSWPVCRPVVDGPTTASVLVRRTEPSTGALPAGGQLLLVQTVVSGGGTIRGPGVACPRRCDWYLPGGRFVTIRAVPSRHHRFLMWAGFCQGRRRTCRLRVGVNEYAAAVFRR